MGAAQGAEEPRKVVVFRPFEVEGTPSHRSHTVLSQTKRGWVVHPDVRVLTEYGVGDVFRVVSDVMQHAVAAEGEPPGVRPWAGSRVRSPTGTTCTCTASPSTTGAR